MPQTCKSHCECFPTRTPLSCQHARRLISGAHASPPVGSTQISRPSSLFSSRLATTQHRRAYPCACKSRQDCRRPMAGADGQRRLWDLSRRAASFMRMARLVLTGAAAPAARLVAEEEEKEIVGGGRSCDTCYRSVSTEDDDWESDELWLDEDELDLLVDEDDDDDGSSRTRGVSSENSTQFIGSLSKKPQFVGRRPPATSAAALRRRPEDAAAAESSEPLVPRRAVTRTMNDAEMVSHPFGCDRRGSESSSLLLVSS